VPEAATVYLDICCYKRPFDDGTDERIRREAEAVADRNPREDRRLATRLWLDAATVQVTAASGAAERARELNSLGFTPLDALHLAFAEQAGARLFVTTDDRLLKRDFDHRDRLRVEMLAPDHVASRIRGDRA
jgi:predicted nucleic acid-binding protein